MAGIKSSLIKQQSKVQTQEEKKLREQGKKLQKIIKDKMAKSQSKVKRSNVEAIDKWKDEIKNKGDGAKDLSEFMSNSKENLGVKKRGLYNKNPMGSIRKGGKQRKQHRPSKVARLQNKNKKMSMNSKGRK